MRKKEDIETIYKGALPVFGRFGYAKTTMEAVADALGMTKGNLYLYVKNKKELYRETVAWALRSWQNRVREAVEREKEARLRFQVMCTKAVEYLAGDTDFKHILQHDPDIFPMFGDNDPFEAINAESTAMIRNILEQGVREKTFRPVNTDGMAQVLFMIYKMFIIRWYIQGKDTGREIIFKETMDLMTHGLFCDEPDR